MEAIKETREERKARIKGDRDAQYALDMEAIEGIEAGFDDDQELSILVGPYRKGIPVCVALRAPSSAELKKYRHQVSTATKGKTIDSGAIYAAGDELAFHCCVYPDKATLLRVAELRANALVDLATEAIKLGQLSADAEGKG